MVKRARKRQALNFLLGFLLIVLSQPLSARDFFIEHRAIVSGSLERRLVASVFKADTNDEGGDLEKASSLTPVWSAYSVGRIIGIATLGNTICWATEEGQVYLAEAQNGQLKKSLDIGQELSPGLSSGQSNYWLSAKDKLIGLNEEGEKVLELSLPGPLSHQVMEDRGQLFLFFKNSLEVRDGLKGNIIWKYEPPVELSGSSVVTEKEVFISTISGQLLRLDRKNGRLKNQYDFKEAISSIAVPDNKSILLGFVEGRVQRFVLDKNKVSWKIDLGTQRVESFLIHGKKVYVLTSGGLLFKLSLLGGNLDSWQVVPGRAFSQPLIFREEILVLSSTPFIYGFDLKLGKQSSETQLKYEVKTGLAVWKDLLFTGSYDFRENRSLVIAFKKEPQVIIRASKESPQAVGRRIVFTVQASGFEKPKYEFFLSLDNEQPKLVRKASKLNTWTWIPGQSGDYKIIVRVTDKKLSKISELRYNITSFIGE